MALMRLTLRPLGSTGLRVPPIGFGGAPIGLRNYLTAADRDDAAYRTQAAAAIDTALRHGLILFDTAPGYGFGRSETIIGAALEGRRDGVVLASKVKVTPGDASAAWTDSLRASLDRLRTDRVDLLQLHGNTWPDELAGWAIGEPLEWLREMRGRRLTRHIGFTAETPSGGVERMVRSGGFETLQVAYGVIYQGACDHQRSPFGVVPLARSLGLGVFAMRTTTSGVLQKLLATEFAELDPDRITRLAIRFVLSTPEIDCALIGMQSPAEVEANCAIAADPSDRIDVRALHDFYQGRPREAAPARSGDAV